MCLLLAAGLIACSSVAFTGRNRMLLYSDSEITSLSNDSYNELMATTKVSDNKAQAAMIQEVGERLTGALTKYLASRGEQSLLDDITWSFKLVQDSQVNVQIGYSFIGLENTESALRQVCRLNESLRPGQGHTHLRESLQDHPGALQHLLRPHIAPQKVDDNFAFLHTGSG